MIYFENASSSLSFFEDTETELFFADTQKQHQKAIESRVKLEQARKNTANLLNTTSDTIFFTPNGTYANNIAINSIPDNSQAIVTSVCEHSSVLLPILQKSKQLKIPVIYCKYKEDTGIDLADLKSILKKYSQAFVSLAHVNQYTGRMLPISRIAEICEKNDAIFHSDISQSIGKFDINFENIKIDIATASGQSIGVRGGGVIYANKKMKLKPLILGEKNEYGIVSGSENIQAIISLSNTLDYISKNRLKFRNYLIELKNYLKNELKKREINFSSKGFSEENFSPYIININFPEIKDFDAFLIKLDLNDVYIVDGKCAKLDMFNNIILSFSPQNTKTEINQFVKIVEKLHV